MASRGPQLDSVAGVWGDFSAQVSGLISSATGSFPSVTGVTSESDPSDPAFGDNAYTLQLNTEQFVTSACSGAAIPEICCGFQQFVYFNWPNAPDQNGVEIVQFLLAYCGNSLCGTGGTTCPTGWLPSVNNCFRSSESTTVRVQPITNLANLRLTGTVVSGGMDTVILSTGDGILYATSQDDSPLNLAQGWHQAQYDIFGAGNGSKAIFNSGSTIIVGISLVDGSPAAPTCLEDNRTAETNSLTLAKPCCSLGGASPGITFTESNVAGALAPFCPFDLVPIISLLL